MIRSLYTNIFCCGNKQPPLKEEICCRQNRSYINTAPHPTSVRPSANPNIFDNKKNISSSDWATPA